MSTIRMIVRYFIDLSGKIDGSSRFGADKASCLILVGRYGMEPS